MFVLRKLPDPPNFLIAIISSSRVSNMSPLAPEGGRAGEGLALREDGFSFGAERDGGGGGGGTEAIGGGGGIAEAIGGGGGGTEMDSGCKEGTEGGRVCTGGGAMEAEGSVGGVTMGECGGDFGEGETCLGSDRTGG